MIVRVLSPGTRPPQWLRSGFEEYAGRLTRDLVLELHELPLSKGRSPRDNVAREGERLLEAVPAKARIVALDRTGQAWDTRQLASRLESWQQGTSLVCLLIGGPDGLAEECLLRADEVWSLSLLTFPHLLVRVLVAEQIYRAWSFNHGHPYHRDS